MTETDLLADRVLVLAPTGKDAGLIGAMLGNAGLASEACHTVKELAAKAIEGAGAAVFAEEALIGVSIKPLISALDQQPPWSDFPLLFLTTTGREASATSTSLLTLLGPHTNITLLERPIRVATLMSSIRSALRARHRQYEVRNYLEARKRSEEELLQSQKLESLGVLAGGVAHDFNNLLTGILGNASLAVDLLPPGFDSIRSALADVIHASERAAHLTKQLLAYAGKGKLVIEPVDLTAMVREISHLVQSTIPQNVQMQLDLSDALPMVDADASQVQQVVMNLIINAAEAIPAGRTGNVRVTTGLRQIETSSIQQTFGINEIKPGRYVTLEVQDTGVGMDEVTKARIFDPFFTTKFAGRGLGLAAVMGIMRGHNGALKVDSAPGKGSTFQALFPAAEYAKTGPGPAKRGSAPQNGSGRTILVIDDESTVRRTAKASLERLGYDIILAENGADGIEVFRALGKKISAVLLDLTMPGMNGEEVFQRLKTIRTNVKVILSSGFNEVEVIQRFSGRGLAGFLQKPYTSAALAQKMSDILQE